MKEEFRDIQGFDGLYQVSNFGRIKSLGNNATRKDKILKPFNNNGYEEVKLWIKGKRNNYKVHQLVALVFLNHSSDGTTKIVVDHINNNSLDNRLENLQLISHRENLSKDKKGSSKYTGVSFDKKRNKWAAYIMLNYKNKHLGYFDCETKAHFAYLKSLKEIENESIKQN